ncbi:MAG: metallophosphoesterase [Oscillospiraceae bacterium]|nr:metallophosphoesterase [Oscillospiraceae bacterium]
MTIRYLADMHFDHANIIAYDNRPFNSVDEMNEALIANWNRVVTDPEDLTWILGDFCVGDAARWRELLGRLNGRKALIFGNHDDPGTVEAVRGLFEDAAEYREILDGGRHVVLCHYPILAFRDHYFGWVHLYGHVHSSYEWNVTENAKRLLKQLYVREDICRMFNTGAMLPYMNYTPRTLDEIVLSDTPPEQS